MIKKVHVTNPDGDVLTLDLYDPWASGFYVKKITGLEPPKATINSTRLATLDGAFYNSARVGPRNIVMSLGLLENPTVEHTRRNSYKFFPLKKKIGLAIETDIRTYFTEGYVESNEPEIFSQQEDTSISIVCMQAYFNAGNIALDGYEYVDFYNVIPKLEFPMFNDSLATPLIELGGLDVSLSRIIEYEGDVSTGIEIYATIVANANTWRITNVETGEYMEIDNARIFEKTGEYMLAGDSVFISTVKGEKRILFTSDTGVTYNIINALAAGSSWLQINPGANYFAYSGSTTSALRLQIRYKPLYEGV